MSRRGGKKRTNSDRYFYGADAPTSWNLGKRGNFEAWQSTAMNQRAYQFYIDMMVKMATSRFRWLNLPTTCDERYLELTLITQGCATIAFPKKMRGTFLSLQCAQQGKSNMYDRPNEWLAIGQNGTRFTCDRTQGVVIYDNETRYPLLNGIELYANELTHIRMTRNMNRLHQQIPFILKGPQEKEQDMINMFKQVAGGEPAIIGTEDMDSVKYETMSTGVEFLGEQLALDEKNVWNNVYSMLGITNSTIKQERMTEDEIQAQKQPSSLIAASALSERRKAAKELNKRFGAYLDAPIEVIFRQENESDNWNLLHNYKQMQELGE